MQVTAAGRRHFSTSDHGVDTARGHSLFVGVHIGGASFTLPSRPLWACPPHTQDHLVDKSSVRWPRLPSSLSWPTAGTGRGTLPVAGRASSSARHSRGRQEPPPSAAHPWQPSASKGGHRPLGPVGRVPAGASKAGEEARQWRGGAGAGEGKQCPPVAGEGCSGQRRALSLRGQQPGTWDPARRPGSQGTAGPPGLQTGNRRRGVTGNCSHHTRVCLLTCAF